MRNRWPQVKLHELVQANRSITYGIVQPKGFVVEGVPLVRGGDYSSGWAPLNDVKRVRPEVDAPYKRSRLRAGDLVITIVGANTGNVARVPTYLDGANITQTTARLAIDERIADSEYVLQYLKSELGKRQVYRYVKGGAQPGLNLSDLRLFKIPLPTLPTQRQIAKILSLWDQAIGTADQLIELMDKRSAWTRTYLLTGERRLPGHLSKWETDRLAAVLTDHKLKSSGREEVYSVSVQKGLVNQIEHLGRSYSAKTTAHYNRVKPGDIVYTKSPTGDFPLGIIKRSSVLKDVIVSPLYGVFTPTTPEIGIILDALFESPINVRNYLAPLVQKGAKNTIAITNKRFLEGSLSLPVDPEEQAKLAALITTAKAEKEAVQKWKQLLERQRSGLMQKLFSDGYGIPEDAGKSVSSPHRLKAAP